ncbi:MAG: hypothetical protein PVI03_03665, partial [Candidatus Thorarchaeota archaeon]
MVFVALFFISSITTEVVSAEETPIVARGELVPITAMLLQNGTFGDPVINQYLFFYDQTLDIFIGSAVTDSNGYATVLWNVSIDHPLGLSLLNVTFEGNASLFLAPSYQWSSIIVVSHTFLEVRINEQAVHPDDEIILTARIVDDHNVSIAGASMAVYRDNILLSAASSNISGYVTFIIDCNVSWCTIGENTLRVVFEQDLGRFLNTSENSISIIAQQVTTTLDTQGVYDSEVQLNDSFWMQMIIQAEGENHSNASLVVFLDENPIDVLVSDGNGLATLSLNIDSRYILGIHTLKIEYMGTFRYAASYLELEITVISPAVILVELPESVQVGVETAVQVVFYDLLQRPVPNATITLFDELTQESYLIPFSPGQTIATSQIIFSDPLGPRHLQITVLDSPFLTNKTGTVLVTIWSKPNLFIIHQSILGYASPSQVATFQIQLNASGIQIPNGPIEWHLADRLVAISTTNHNGIAEETFELPLLEGAYQLVISYNGSISEYELPTILEYEIIVSRIVPVAVNLVSYSVSTALQEISVQLSIIALNGTLLGNIEIHYEWLSHRSFALSQVSGIVEFGLRIPAASGVYNLYYETEEAPFIHSSTGYHIIIISETEAMAAQGVGIPILTLSLGISVSLV